jgi:hypothetical protein
LITALVLHLVQFISGLDHTSLLKPNANPAAALRYDRSMAAFTLHFTQFMVNHNHTIVCSDGLRNQVRQESPYPLG